MAPAMSILHRLASNLGRRDENPNQALAKEIAGSGNTGAIKELIENLNNRDKAIQSDCIKVLYEIGEQKPALISTYAKDFIALLDSKNNRLQWGAMTALKTIAPENLTIIYAALPKLAAIAETGSVITRDNYVFILIKLCSEKEYADNAFALLHEQLLTCPANQLPMYAEKALAIINPKNRTRFVEAVSSRLDDLEKATKRDRIEKLLRKVQKK